MLPQEQASHSCTGAILGPPSIARPKGIPNYRFWVTSGTMSHP